MRKTNLSNDISSVRKNQSGMGDENTRSSVCETTTRIISYRPFEVNEYRYFSEKYSRAPRRF